MSCDFDNSLFILLIIFSGGFISRFSIPMINRGNRSPVPNFLTNSFELRLYFCFEFLRLFNEEYVSFPSSFKLDLRLTFDKLVIHFLVKSFVISFHILLHTSTDSSFFSQLKLAKFFLFTKFF